MMKSLVLLLFVLVEVSRASQQVSEELSLYNTLMCSISTDSWKCLKGKIGRALDVSRDVLKTETEGLLGEADRDFAISMQSRGLLSSTTQPEDRQEKPSILIQSIETSVDELSGIIAETYDDLVSPETKQTDESFDTAGGFDESSQIQQVIGEDRKKKHKHGIKISKKGKKKLLAKFFLIGAVLKAKIELLLKLITVKLQVKFLLIAFIALIINIARFWIDFKKGHHPQKVIYYENAQHEHHYDEHDGYWKRSIDIPLPKTQDNYRTEELNYNEENPEYRIDETAQYRNLEETYPAIPVNDKKDAANKFTDAHLLAYSNSRPIR